MANNRCWNFVDDGRAVQSRGRHDIAERSMNREQSGCMNKPGMMIGTGIMVIDFGGWKRDVAIFLLECGMMKRRYLHTVYFHHGAAGAVAVRFRFQRDQFERLQDGWESLLDL
ncbi:hypothetical protein F6P93_17400 [Escherichia coli]|nr:hypothetical protein F6P93_17400 [Escherichia coli]